MLAAVCRRFGAPLSIEEVRLGEPGPGEVEVALGACAICHSDIHFIDGAWGGDLPAVFGHEAAGRVVRLGEGVDDLALGEHVVVTLVRACGHCYFCDRQEPTTCDHAFSLAERRVLSDRAGQGLTQGMGTAAFAERVLVHRSQVVAVPADLPFDVASLLACGVITGVGAVTNTAAVPAGASVAVIGTGGVGLNVVQGAAIAGADPIIAIDLVPEKRRIALSFGATAAIDPLVENVPNAVKALTGGRGADYVFVSVGSKTAIEAGMKLMRRGGALVIVGMPANGVVIDLDPTGLAAAGQRILGSKMGGARIASDIPLLVELYRDGRLKLDALVSARYPLGAIDEAIAASRGGAALRNVIVF